VETVQRLADTGPVTAAEAVREGLVDRVGYRDQVLADVRRRVGGSGETPPLLLTSRYTRRTGPAALVRRLPGRSRRVVALVIAAGTIHQGRSRRGPLGGASAGSDTVGAALRSAGRDASVGAVVLRVDSGGGSYVASDAIAREVALLRAGGTPVVVSMGSVAASGGYFIAAPADRVLALPGTLTGSIGVLAGKLVTRGLADRVGLHRELVTAGDHAAMLTTTRLFTADELARLDAWLDEVYDDFVGQVACGRGLSRGEVEAVARGRVWTGADALDRGLVDELGGLGAAADTARQLAGLPADAELRRWPQVGPLDRLRPPTSSDDPAAVTARFDPWSGFGSLAAALGLPAAGPLALPPLERMF
jgi:protease-4